MLRKDGDRLPTYRTPKLIFPELLRPQPFRKQSVQLFLRSGKTRHSALFDGRQSRLHNFLKRPVAATAYHSLNSPLLLRCEMNCHA